MFYIYHMIAHTPGANIRINLGRSSWCNIDCIAVCGMVALASPTSTMVLTLMAIIRRGSELFNLNPRSPTRCLNVNEFCISRLAKKLTKRYVRKKINKRTKNTNDNDTRTIYIAGLAITRFSITRPHSFDY